MHLVEISNFMKYSSSRTTYSPTMEKYNFFWMVLMVLVEQPSQPFFCETKKLFWVANFESCHGGVYITLKKIWYSRILRALLHLTQSQHWK